MTEKSSSNEYLVSEKKAAQLLDFSPRFLQSRRLRGDGPVYVRISQRALPQYSYNLFVPLFPKDLRLSYSISFRERLPLVVLKYFSRRRASDLDR